MKGGYFTAAVLALVFLPVYDAHAQGLGMPWDLHGGRRSTIQDVDVRVRGFDADHEFSEQTLQSVSELVQSVFEYVDQTNSLVRHLVIHLDRFNQSTVQADGTTLQIYLPFENVRNDFADFDTIATDLNEVLHKVLLSSQLLGGRYVFQGEPVISNLEFLSILVSVAPFVGEVYDSLCLATGKELITNEEFGTVDKALVAAGLLTAVGSGIVFYKLYRRARVVVFSQPLMDMNGTVMSSGIELRKLARGLRSRAKFKFVELGNPTPETAAKMIRKELKRGSTVVLNTHGTWDEVYTGATETLALKNDDLLNLVGRNLGGNVYDASCFSSTRRSIWEKIVGPRGRVLTLLDEGADTTPGTLEVLPRFIRGDIHRTYDHYLLNNKHPFATYVQTSGRP